MPDKEKEKKRNRRYYEANREKALARQKAYREANREKIKAYREANREKRLAKMRAWHEANREKVLARLKAYNKPYREANREKILAQDRARHKANREKIRARKLKTTYGITIEVYNTLIDGQHFLCSICHKPAFEDGKPLHVDHDHKTGWVRGLLCRSCNASLGGFNDDPALLQRAIEYLHFHNREGKLPINQATKKETYTNE